ncbi:MAG: hypothetical protein FJX47_14005 [Alphaproteobacteria bacterium]|nr:hypothetical protein [Alphaproteobacteria bacterium]
MLRRVWEWFNPTKVDSAARLFEALDAEATHIAQKVPLDYCEAKTHTFAAQLFSEKEFIDALLVCRRESYIAVLAGLMVLAEGMLRPAAALQAVAVADRLGLGHGPILARHVADLALSEEGIAAAKAGFSDHYAAAREQPVAIPADIGTPAAERLFATLPLHSKFTENDKDAVVSTVQLRFTMFHQALGKRLDRGALIADLLAGSG